MTNAEIIADIGIEMSDIPSNVQRIMKTINEPVHIQIKNDRGEVVIDKAINIKELMGQL
jgi:hypothetical protein